MWGETDEHVLESGARRSSDELDGSGAFGHSAGCQKVNWRRWDRPRGSLIQLDRQAASVDQSAGVPTLLPLLSQFVQSRTVPTVGAERDPRSP